MTLINLTPHELLIIRGDGDPLVLPVGGTAPRLAVSREDLGTLFGLPIVRSTMGRPEGLPPAEPDTVFVVSALVAEAAKDRSDLAYPGEAVRDDAGRIVGANGLCAGPGLADILRTENAEIR